MTTDPTDLIAQADAALDGVTPGPWRAGTSEFYPGLSGPLTTRVYTASPTDEIEVSGDDCRRNARFIAASRQLVPALRDALIAQDAVVAALEAEVARLRRALSAAKSDLHEIEAGNMSTFEAQDAIDTALLAGRAVRAEQGEAG
jgi:hypothetical protein